VAGLAILGLRIDGTLPLRQGPLFFGLQAASIGGALLGAWAFRWIDGPSAPLWRLVLAVALGWRLAYFPIMVFSGHVASIGEWLLLVSGLPVFVYPSFLVSVAAIHAAAAAAAGLLVHPPRRWLRPAVLPAFLVAAAVSFNQLSDLTLLPDRVISVEAPIPPMESGRSNPYLPALRASGYLPNQRVVLLAAGLTYETIPPSPWATTVKAVLEGLFHARPFGSTQERVLEHYLAYHSAHAQIGCRALADCPPDAP
jgi:hypothetical protein